MAVNFDVEMDDMKKMEFDLPAQEEPSFSTVSPTVIVTGKPKYSRKCAFIATGIIATACVILLIGTIGACVWVAQITKDNKECISNIDMEQWEKVDAVCENHATALMDEPCSGVNGTVNISPAVVHQLYMTLDMIKNHECKNYLIKVFENAIDVEFCGGVMMKVTQDLVKYYQHDIKAIIISPDEIKYSSFDVVDLLSNPHGMFKKTVQFFDYIELSDGIKYISVSSVCRYFNK